MVAAAAKDPIQWARALPKVFADLDLDRNGNVDSAELAKALPALNVLLSPPELAAFAKALDPNGDGVITFGEFDRAVAWRLPAKPPAEAKAAKAAARDAQAALEHAQRAKAHAQKASGAKAKSAKHAHGASDLKHAWASVLEAATANPRRFNASIDGLFAKLNTDGSGEVCKARRAEKSAHAHVTAPSLRGLITRRRHIVFV